RAARICASCTSSFASLVIFCAKSFCNASNILEKDSSNCSGVESSAFIKSIYSFFLFSKSFITLFSIVLALLYLLFIIFFYFIFFFSFYFFLCIFLCFHYIYIFFFFFFNFFYYFIFKCNSHFLTTF